MLRKVLPTCALASTLLLACGDDATAVDASLIDAAPNTGTFSLAWSLSDGTNAISCEDVGAVSVTVTLIPQGGLSGEVEPFSCGAGEGTSRGLQPGIYDVAIDVRASGLRSLLPEKVEIRDFEIVAKTETALPDQSFTIAPVGNFSFYATSGASAGNCAAVDADGGGIVGFEFALEDASGACVEADFVVADGSQPGGTYSSNCTTPPAPLPCIGGDQLITVSSIPSGPWSMEITAQKEGPIDCYSRGSSFTVAGAELTTEVGSLEMDLEYSAECDPNFVPPDGGMVDAGMPDA